MKNNNVCAKNQIEIKATWGASWGKDY